MTPEVDPGFWKWVASIAWMPVGGLATLAWVNLTGRVKRMEDASSNAVIRDDLQRVEAIATAALPRADFDKALIESRADRANIRLDITKLFDKIESAKDLNNQQVNDVRRQLSEDIGKLRADVNGGFQRLYETIVQNRKG